MYHHRRGCRYEQKREKAYLLFGPGELVLKLSLLVEESLVLSAQRSETLRQLIGKLRHVPSRIITHDCASFERCSGGVAVSLGQRPAPIARQRGCVVRWWKNRM